MKVLDQAVDARVVARCKLMVGFIFCRTHSWRTSTMPELPDPRSVSADALNLWRLLAVRAVVDFKMSQADAAAQYGVSSNTMSQWVSLYREQGEAGFGGGTPKPPPGAGGGGF